MNPWIALVIGLFVGWLIELLIDLFYWRKRRLCPDDEALNLKASLEQAQNDNRTLQISLDENKGRLGQLETDLTARDARITGLLENVDECDGRVAALTADLDARMGEIEGLNGRVGELDAALADRDVQLGSLRADLESKTIELGKLEAELGDIDTEVEGLGIGSLFAGGGLALRGFFGDLKERFTGLEADLETKDAELNDLRVQVEGGSVDVDSLNARIGGLEADLSARNAELANLRAELDAKNAELGQIHAELGDIDGEMEGLGMGSLFAGGGLALGGFFANLKDRFSGEAEAETRGADIDVALNAKDAEIASLNAQVGDLEQKLSVCNASLLEMRTNLGADFKGAQGLSMVWGMNTAASDLLANRGIYTYNQLAATQVDDVNDAIELSGEYYQEMDNVEIHGSWVEQSRLAGAGDWDGLNAYQQQRFDLINLRDDLKKIWGIGPKVEQVMNDNGIYLFAQMASVPPDRITEILRRAGSRFSMSTGKLHDTWPEQARLADQGDWDAFQVLKDTLDWSKLHGE